MLAAVAELVDPDPTEALEAVLLEEFVDQPLGDRAHGGPGDPHELGDGGQGQLLGHQGHGVLKGSGEGAGGPRPGDLLGEDGLARGAPEPPDRPLEVGGVAEEGEVAPAAPFLLEAAPDPGAAVRAGEAPERAGDLDHQDRGLLPLLLLEADGGHPQAGQPQEPVHQGGRAHLIPSRSGGRAGPGIIAPVAPARTFSIEDRSSRRPAFRSSRREALGTREISFPDLPHRATPVLGEDR